MRARDRYFDLFRRYVAPEWRQIVLLAGLLGASIVLQLVGPQLLRSFIDGAVRGESVDVLTRIAVLFVAVALAQQLLAAIATYAGESLGWTATNALRADLALHCLTLDLGFHKARTPGELIERIDGDVAALAGFFSRFSVNVLGNVILLAGVLVAVTVEDVRAGLALAIFAVVAGTLLLGPLRTVAVGRWRQVREVSAQLYGFLAERLGGTEDIRSSGAETHVLNGLALHHRMWLASRRRAMRTTAAIWSALASVLLQAASGETSVQK